jgi:hypothetical protein
MRLSLLLVLAALWLLACHGTIAPLRPTATTTSVRTGPLSSDDVLERVDRAYAGAGVLQLRFEQLVWQRAENTSRRWHGRIVLERQGRFRVTFDGAANRWVVSDGRWVDQSLDAAGIGREPVERSRYFAVLCGFLGRSALSRMFFFEAEVTYSPDSSEYILSGRLRQRIEGVTKILFYVERATSLLRRVLLIDELGNREATAFGML